MRMHLIPSRRAIAAALFGFMLLGLAPAGASATAVKASRSGPAPSVRVRVKITAVYYDPYVGADPDTNAGRNKEYVVIHNGGHRTMKLRGWTLRDLARLGSQNVYHFPRFRLRPGKTVRIHTGSGTNTRTDLYWGSSVYVWGDDSDKATLENAAGTIISTCAWTSTDTSPKYC